jgi:hypothetical protein
MVGNTGRIKACEFSAVHCITQAKDVQETDTLPKKAWTLAILYGILPK